MFELLTDGFTKLQRRLRGYGRLSSKEVADAMRDVRAMLLEADVNYKVVGQFVRQASGRLKQENVEGALKPGEVVSRVLFQELTELLGGGSQRGKARKFELSATPAVVCLVGLQGTGKTTFAGKLAHRYKSRKPLLVACDHKRPAAAEQLRLVASQTGCEYFPPVKDPAATCIAAIRQATKNGNGLVLLDTAGRLHTDPELMAELRSVQEAARPHSTLLVLDGMVGQDAVAQATQFTEAIRLDGCCVTKLDGDTRGGAVVSVRHTTGLPIHFIGSGEKPADLEEFHPERVAARIMGLGDMATFAEKVQTAASPASQKKAAEKFLKGEFDLNDFLAQLRNIKKVGSLSKLLALVPGMKDVDLDDTELVRVEAMILSMTPEERRNPEIIDGSRRRRIAEGSGSTVPDVNRLLKEFRDARTITKRLPKGKLPGLR